MLDLEGTIFFLLIRRIDHRILVFLEEDKYCGYSEQSYMR